MELIVFAARVVLAVVFAVAGFAKLADPKGTRALAKDFGSPDGLAGVITWLLPIAELACAVALFPSSTATFGAAATLAMLVVFIVAIGVSLARGRRPHCRCFGQVHSAPVGGTTLARNVVLAGLAAFVIVQGNATGQPAVADAWRSFPGLSAVEASGAGIALLVVFGLTAAGALTMTYQLLRQHGRLALRIDALEARLGPEPVVEPGLAVDTVAPAFSRDAPDEGQVLLFFKSAGCGACEAMLPQVAVWQREHQDRLSIVTVEDEAVAAAYLVTAYPSAVLIEGGMVASALATGDEAIQSLVRTATASPPYAHGDLVSTLLLPDLDGRTVDLGQLAGRRTVLLFWNPGCGFCSGSLDDVKRWERHRDAELAGLIVISQGDEASNRAQGFTSPVLLDQDFAAGSRFGARGTPSAVIVDELGRVASAVAVGAPEVLALAGSASPARQPAT